ncbi:MAG: lactonase family protein [Marinoscillum sp.]|uniref:lactonase family protein n=1 Tax=Marinoscillum sp. TaxID=2024838 RepID=UPI0032FCF9D4
MMNFQHLTALLLGIFVLSCTQKNTKMDLLIGTYTDQTSEGIYRVSFDTQTGELTDLRLAVKAASPSYLSISPDRKYVYAVGERGDGAVVAYEWEQDSLKRINQVSSMGINPCYVDFSANKKLVAVANYSSGNGAVYAVAADGSIVGEPSTYQHEGVGLDSANRQEAAHAHCSMFSKDSRFVYVVDLGIDQVVGYPVIDGGIGDGFTALSLVPGDGPRHMVFHPTKDMAFLINELSNSVISIKVDVETGMLTEIDRANTVPEDFTEHSQCADIHLSSDGKFLYGSNRGHDSIAIFAVGESGELERIGVESVQGKWPRNFTLSPDERFLLVANKDTDNITVFSRDPKTGLLTYTDQEIAVSRPVCLKF